MAPERPAIPVVANGQLLGLVLASAPDHAIVTLDPTGRVLAWDPSAHRLFGHAAAAVLGQPLDCLFSPDDVRAGVPADLLREAAAHGRAAGEHWMVRQDGGRFWAHATLAALRDPAGRDDPAGAVQGYAVVLHDRTQAMRAEEALRRSEAMLRAFYDHSPFLMGVTELLDDGDILHVYDNPATCRFFKVAPGATAGKRALAELAAEPEVVRVWRAAYLASQAAGRAAHLEHSYHVGGQVRWLSATVFPLDDPGGPAPGGPAPGGPAPGGPAGERARFCYVAEDVTDARAAVEDLRRGKEALRTRTAQLNFALASTGVGMWLNTMPLGRLDWDERTRELFFIPPGVEPTIDLFWSRLHPDDREPTRLAIEAALRDRTLYAIDHRVVDPDTGQVRWIRSAGQATYDEHGAPIRFDGVNYDITARKRLEEDLRQAAARLAEADRKKDEFLATLAHELRNPLAPIRNAVQVLRVKGPADPDLVWSRDVIDRQVRQMARLLDDLLDVSRITRNRLELRKTRTSLAAVLDCALETSRPLLEQRRQEVVTTLPEAPVPLEADVTRLAQVFANLLNNAARYSDAGGRVVLTAVRQGGEVAVSVRDSGIGIDAGHLGTIFEMFSQAAPALERSQGGLGIGLALARGLVELHGGTIEAQSDGPGLGSEFIVRLPVAASAGPPPGASTSGGGVPAGSRLRILVVDDNKDGADSLALMLRALGHDTRTAYDGAAALAVAAECRPDVILLDLGLPRLNGYEVCRRLREQPWGRRALVVAQTGWGQDSDRARTRASGFDHHLVKPVDLDSLIALLATVQPTRV